MVRRFVDLDGYVLGEEEWQLRSVDKCFYCDGYLMVEKDNPCPVGFLNQHDFISLCARQFI